MNSAMRRLRGHLQGQPNAVLTIGLLLAAGVLVLVALQRDPLVKAAVLAWVILP